MIKMEQTCIENLSIPIGDFIKDFTNENCRNLMPLSIPIIFNILFSNPILMNNKFFYINKEITDKILYERKNIGLCSNNELRSIAFDNFSISTQIIEYDEEYKNKCREEYKNNNKVNERILILENEIIKTSNICERIINVIVPNLNFKGTHFSNVKNKLKPSDKYKKPIYCWVGIFASHDSYNISKHKIIKKMSKILKQQILYNINEIKFFIYFTICKILTNFELYKKYLMICIENIKNDCFNLHDDFAFNNILIDKIVWKKKDEHEDIEPKYNDLIGPTSYYDEFYIFKDFNICAIDKFNHTKCVEHCLALDNMKKKWNIFPRNNENKNYHISTEQIQNMINTIKLFEDEGIDLFEQPFSI